MKDRFLTFIAYSFPVLFICGIVYLNYFTISSWRFSEYLHANGKVHTGTVIKKELSYSKGGDRYYLTYTYLSPGSGKSIENRIEVDYNTHLLNSEGKEVQLLLDSLALERSTIQGNDAISMTLFITILLDLVLLSVLIGFWIKASKQVTP